ncbi:Transcription factor skn7 [Globisporangium polare]
MAAGIATGFVRKLYRILDLESDAVISWDATGLSFSIHDAEKLNADVLPRYFRGRLCAFRQQLVDHGFEQLECEDNETREVYRHEHFLKGCPAQLSLIARVPKPKRKQQQQPTVTVTIGGNGKANEMMPALLNVKQPSANRSLTVTLNAGVKRASPSVQQQQKRVRSEQQHQQASSSLMVTAKLSNNSNSRANHNSNPLFSNEPDASALSFARLAESGLLPHSSDLPEPISYLAKLTSQRSSSSMAQAQANQAQVRMAEPPIFSDDLFRSALFFLASTSTTGVEPPANTTTTTPSTQASADKNGSVMVSSNLLSMLLASSTSGMPATTSTGSNWGSGSGVSSNPLFSDQSAGDDDEDQDSIWNLLVASSVDRVKSAIGDIESPQERLKVILAERERLEEQRKKFSRVSNGSGIIGKETSKASTVSSGNPLFAKSTGAASGNPLFAKTSSAVSAVARQNGNSPLFAKSTNKPSSPAAAHVVSSSNSVMLGGRGGTGAPNEDDLWRLLMSSSIDSFRRIGEFEV